jgi:hypothetical protein
LIPQIEQELIRECLGKTLGEYLKAHLTAYPDPVVEWDETASYSIGDVVIRNLTTYTSTANSNASDPIVSGSSWDIFKRFDTAGANELWEGYLRQVLCMQVYNASLASSTYRSGAGGMVINAGDSSGFRSVNKTELLSVMATNEAFIKMTMGNMEEWLTCNYVEKGLPMPACLENCDLPGRRSRRWAFR